MWVDPGTSVDLSLVDGMGEVAELADGLWLVVVGETRSRLYHRVKSTLPDGTPLVVAPLADWPKFRGVAPGSLDWVRRHDHDGSGTG